MTKKFKTGHNEKRKLLGKSISSKAFEAPDIGSTDQMNPVFSFSDTCPNHFQLDQWKQEELKHLTDKLREYSKKTWAEIKSVKGFIIVGPKHFNHSFLEYVSKDVTIYECRISKRARLFGHRVRNVCFPGNMV